MDNKRITLFMKLPMKASSVPNMLDQGLTMTSQRYPLMERVSDLKTGLPAKVTVTGAPLRQQVRTSRKRQSSFRASQGTKLPLLPSRGRNGDSGYQSGSVGDETSAVQVVQSEYEFKQLSPLRDDVSVRTSHRADVTATTHLTLPRIGGLGTARGIITSRRPTSPGADTVTTTRSKKPGTSRGGPLTAEDALREYSSHLSPYEQKEILAFSNIYYIGTKATQKVIGLPGAENNSGYDDNQGSYIRVIGDHLFYRYEVLDNLGKGSFGHVVKAHDHKTGVEVAIKIIRNKRKFHKQADVEVKILDHLRRKDKNNQLNVVHILDNFVFRNHVCMVFELLGCNLYELMKQNKLRGFNSKTVRKMTRSILHCLVELKSSRIIHCDLKPENILLRSNGGGLGVKVIDFGSSCFDDQTVYTYIQSRFYRAPEIILGLPYTTAIDMWSLGCIVAELHMGFPLLPGEDEADQLACCMEVLGLPPFTVLRQASRLQCFFDSTDTPKKMTNSKGVVRIPGSRDLAMTLKTSDTQLLNFIYRCLDWNAETRMTPQQALDHSWMAAAKTPNMTNGRLADKENQS